MADTKHKMKDNEFEKVSGGADDLPATPPAAKPQGSSRKRKKP